MIRSAAENDTGTLVRLADSTGIFAAGEADALLGHVLAEHHAGRLGEGHQVVVAADERTGAARGWAYFAPNAHAEGVWDLWWIGVSPEAHGEGVGEELLRFAERQARDAGERLLIIETSSTPPLARARRFYERSGYTNCGTIPDFYAEGDGKVTFARRIDR